MASCGYAALVGGWSAGNPENLRRVTIAHYNKDIQGHLRSFGAGLADSSIKNEAELPWSRAGKKKSVENVWPTAFYSRRVFECSANSRLLFACCCGAEARKFKTNSRLLFACCCGAEARNRSSIRTRKWRKRYTGCSKRRITYIGPYRCPRPVPSRTPYRLRQSEHMHTLQNKEAR